MCAMGPALVVELPPYASTNARRSAGYSEQPNRVWVTDITYIRTYEGWLYLAAVMDLYSCQIVGWATRSTMTSDLVLQALLPDGAQRGPRRHRRQSQRQPRRWLPAATRIREAMHARGANFPSP